MAKYMQAAVVLEVILEAIARKLALDTIAGAARAHALGVAALNHEAGDDAVENDAVVVALVDEADEVVDGVGGNLRVKLGLDGAAVFHLNGDDGVLCHSARSLNHGSDTHAYNDTPNQRLAKRLSCQGRKIPPAN